MEAPALLRRDGQGTCFPLPALIRVLLVAKVRLHRDGLATLIEADGRLKVADSSRVSVPNWSSTDADVVVVDTAGAGAAEAAREIAGASALPVIVIGVPEDDEEVVAFAEAGVIGFVEHDATLDELIECVACVARGQASCAPRIATTLLRRMSTLAADRGPRTDASNLTRRERQIVQLIAEGLSNKEIAQRLFIEVATVKHHVHNILEKLQVSRRGEAAAQLRLVERRG
jgi:DNA-binding NarL/FixJ family response regulator